MSKAEIRSHLHKFRVGIAGAGGLGSNCAVSLARSGVGTLVIADFDIVDLPNLDRQYYFSNQEGKPKVIALKENIARIDPAINVITHDIVLDRSNILSVFSGCDIMVEAFDRADMKEMLIETVQLKMPGMPVIAASGLAGWGCADRIKMKKIDDSLYICGDGETEVSEKIPAMAPRVTIAAGLQADKVIELLMNLSKNEDSAK